MHVMVYKNLIRIMIIVKKNNNIKVYVLRKSHVYNQCLWYSIWADFTEVLGELPILK